MEKNQEWDKPPRRHRGGHPFRGQIWLSKEAVGTTRMFKALEEGPIKEDAIVNQISGSSPREPLGVKGSEEGRGWCISTTHG